MIFHRLLQFIRRAAGRWISPTTNQPQSDAASPVKFSTDGDPIRIELDGIVLTFGMVEVGSTPPDDLYDLPPDEPKKAEPTRYRDEDGETRPLSSDRSGLSEMPLEEVAAEFLRAKVDAEAMPDPLEREIIAVLRDAYSRELWRRATRYAVDQVTVGGRRYELVALPAIGYIHLLAVE
jgi:hypothetical protein